MNQDSVLVAIRDLRFRWPGDNHDTLRIPKLEIRAAENLFIMGASGSGKSTLLNLIGGVSLPQAGSLEVLGQDLARMSAGARDRMRADHIGYVFQQFNLIPYLNALENVILPCRFSAARKKRVVERAGSVDAEARRLLDQLFPGSRPDLHKPVYNLSVGQQQRIAAARALIGNPELVIADEPTSSLDFDTREAFMELLLQEVSDSRSTLLFVSHDRSLRPLFNHTLQLERVNRGVSL